MDKATVRDIDVRGKRVLVRVDFNVPLDEGGAITDDTRIRAALPTIRYLLENGAAVILMSHLGRPKGKVNPKYSLRPVAARLSELLGQPVALAPDCVGPAVTAQAQALRPGGVLLLENLRFHPEEEANDPAFAQQLAALGDVYVNDAFGTAHRAHASTEGVAHDLPAVAGFLMEKELNFLGAALEHPEAAIRRHLWRREGFRQDCRAGSPDRHRRCGAGGRRHGEHVLQGEWAVHGRFAGGR